MSLIYVAGKWDEKAHVRTVQKTLTDAGHDVISVWTQSKDTTSENGLRNQALIDYCSLQECDVLVMALVNEEKYTSSSPNRYVEMGIALGRQIPIYILGAAREDEMFHRLPWIKKVEHVNDLVLHLGGGGV